VTGIPEREVLQALRKRLLPGLHRKVQGGYS
jgi:hypothetical protein